MMQGLLLMKANVFYVVTAAIIVTRTQSVLFKREGAV